MERYGVAVARAGWFREGGYWAVEVDGGWGTALIGGKGCPMIGAPPIRGGLAMPRPQDITGANAGQLRQAIFDTNGPDGMQKLVDTLKPYGIDLSSLMQGIPGIAK